MSDQSVREGLYSNRLFKLQKGKYWGNEGVAGELRQDMRAEMALECMKTVNVRRVLELGCGIGNFSKRFIGKGFELEGIDIGRDFIDMLNGKYAGSNLKFRVADVEKLPYDDCTFDCVIGNGVLHHLKMDVCLDQIYRVTRRGGKIFFAEPNMMNPEVFLETKVRFIGKLTGRTEDETAFLKWKIRRQLQKAGFTNIIVEPFDFVHPLLPPFMVGPVKCLSDVLGSLPLVKEIAGSLKIVADKS